MSETSGKSVHVDQFHHDKQHNIWLHPEQGKFAYSDGDKVERRTLEILQNTQDLSLFSNELQSKICDWPTHYHFSPERHNLLRHLRLDSATTVLELGCGCGAITRQLGEMAGEVWAVEGNQTRAASAAARTRDLSNVRVFCSDFQRINTGRQFDVVTLIGVLEYSPIFFAGDDPLLECLKLTRSLLKPGGVLLVAIENQLGLKYFCGAPEDHTGKPYDGVQDLYKAKGPQTRGRVQLTKTLQEAGFPAVQFQYPFPDYKLPSWVFTQRGLKTDGFDPAAILRLVKSIHEGTAVKLAADERKIRQVLFQNGLLEEMSNSFLVLAGSSEDSFKVSPPELLAKGYTTNRQPAFNTQIEMTTNGSGQINVRRSQLITNQRAIACDFEHLSGDEPYRNGQQLEELAVDALTKQGLDAAVVQLRRWIDYVIANGLHSIDGQEIYQSSLKPEYFDVNPRNLIVTLTGLEPIDLEWRYLKPLCLRTAILMYIKSFVSSEERLLRKHLKGRDPMSLQLAKRLGVEVTRQQFEQASEQRRAMNRQTLSQYQLSRVGKKTRKDKSFGLIRRIKKFISIMNDCVLRFSRAKIADAIKRGKR